MSLISLRMSVNQLLKVNFSKIDMLTNRFCFIRAIGIMLCIALQGGVLNSVEHLR